MGFLGAAVAELRSLTHTGPRDSTMTIALPDDFRDLLVSLADVGARFMVVGGYAVAFHGHIRATKDLDVYIDPSPENAPRVERAFDGRSIPVLGRDALVKNKLASGRTQDLADVEVLQRKP